MQPDEIPTKHLLCAALILCPCNPLRTVPKLKKSHGIPGGEVWELSHPPNSLPVEQPAPGHPLPPLSLAPSSLEGSPPLAHHPLAT